MKNIQKLQEKVITCRIFIIFLSEKVTYSFGNHTYYAPKKEAQKNLSHHVVSPKMLEYFAAIAQTLLRFSIKYLH